MGTDGLNVHVWPAFSLTGGFLDAMGRLGTVRTVLGPVGFGNKGRFADSTMFFLVAVEDFRFQRGVSRQNTPSEPLAENRIRNALRAHAGIAPVQQDAIAFIVVAAFLPYQGICPAPMFRRHEWERTIRPAFDGWLLFE